MKIYTQNANGKLFQFQQMIQERHTQWRCLYFGFSEFQSEFKEGLRTHIVVNIIRDLLKEDDGSVFLCPDGDIAILFQGKALPILNKLGTHIQTLMLDDFMPEKHSSLCHVWDLGVHWDEFSEICCAKKAIADAADEAAMETSEPLPATNTPPNISWDVAQFSAMQKKRDNRHELHVLVVEDDRFTRRLINNTLRNHAQTIEAETAMEAIESYQMHAPDMVFLDIDLPDYSGHFVLQTLIKNDPDAFVVMLSGNSFKENILAAFEDGAQGFITKPFTKEKMHHYLDNRKRIKELGQPVSKPLTSAEDQQQNA